MKITDEEKLYLKNKIYEGLMAKQLPPAVVVDEAFAALEAEFAEPPKQAGAE